MESKHIFRRTRWGTFWTRTTTAIVSILLVSIVEQAHGSSSGNAGNEIPYQGTLFQNGAPANGAFDFRFGLFSAANDPSGCLADLALPSPGACGLWAEERPGLQVVGGRFVAILGTPSPPLVEGTIPTAVFNRPQLFIAVAVRANGAPSFVLLGGPNPKHRIVPSTYALSASGGLDARIRLLEGPKVLVRCMAETPVSVGSDVLTRIDYSACDFGTNYIQLGASWAFVAPHSGIFRVSAQVGWSTVLTPPNTSGGLATIILRKATVVEDSIYSVSSSWSAVNPFTSQIHSQLNDLVWLQMGESIYIEAKVEGRNGATTDVGGEGGTMISIEEAGP